MDQVCTALPGLVPATRKEASQRPVGDSDAASSQDLHELEQELRGSGVHHLLLGGGGQGGGSMQNNHVWTPGGGMGDCIYRGPAMGTPV